MNRSTAGTGDFQVSDKTKTVLGAPPVSAVSGRSKATLTGAQAVRNYLVLLAYQEWKRDIAHCDFFEIAAAYMTQKSLLNKLQILTEQAEHAGTMLANEASRRDGLSRDWRFYAPRLPRDGTFIEFRALAEMHFLDKARPVGGSTIMTAAIRMGSQSQFNRAVNPNSQFNRPVSATAQHRAASRTRMGMTAVRPAAVPKTRTIQLAPPSSAGGTGGTQIRNQSPREKGATDSGLAIAAMLAGVALMVPAIVGVMGAAKNPQLIGMFVLPFAIATAALGWIGRRVTPGVTGMALAGIAAVLSLFLVTKKTTAPNIAETEKSIAPITKPTDKDETKSAVPHPVLPPPAAKKAPEIVAPAAKIVEAAPAATPVAKKAEPAPINPKIAAETERSAELSAVRESYEREQRALESIRNNAGTRASSTPATAAAPSTGVTRITVIEIDEKTSRDQSAIDAILAAEQAAADRRNTTQKAAEAATTEEQNQRRAALVEQLAREEKSEKKPATPMPGMNQPKTDDKLEAVKNAL